MGMSLFSPVPFSVHASVPPDLMVSADAAVYVATSLTLSSPLVRS
ncbi:MAG: hypothetical protein ACREI1_12805 [Nitrospiraceae bacterium]